MFANKALDQLGSKSFKLNHERKRWKYMLLYNFYYESIFSVKKGDAGS